MSYEKDCALAISIYAPGWVHEDQSLCLIDRAAIMHDGVVYAISRPYRHHQIIQCVFVSSGKQIADGSQGFLTDRGAFLDRKAAGQLAKLNGQYTGHLHAGELFSEDLW
ncbi:MAG: hypothetical protein ABJA67_03015 [Chthonomonadales bacterium]